MQVAKNTVVTIDYTLTNDDGEILDTSKGHEPLSYIQGIGNIITGLETAMEGRVAGDIFKVSIPPEDAYGIWEESLMQVVPMSAFGDMEGVEIGNQFQIQTAEGPRVMTVVEVTDDEVTLDGNHPLADMTLNFDVAVVNVRPATAEELSHGHVHGAGGHHH
ncbi:peptidylprolyl isomerase [bacterium]|nr:peptidylprolyl isomerase [bacterium]